jgi:hypothetical protein
MYACVPRPDSENEPLFEYKLMPTHIRSQFGVDELRTVELAGPFRFSKGVRVLKVETRPWIKAHPFGTLLFDLQTDPRQEQPLNGAEIEAMMIQYLIRLMQANDAPTRQFERLGLAKDYEAFLKKGRHGVAEP